MLKIIIIVFIFLLSNSYAKTTEFIELTNLKIENNKLIQENTHLKTKSKLYFNGLDKTKNENILFKKLIYSDFKNLEITLKQKNENLNNLLNQYKINEANFNKTLTLYYWISLIGFGLLVAFGMYKASGIYKLKKEVDSYKEENLYPIMEAIKIRQDTIKTISNSVLSRLNNLNNYENKIKEIYKITDNDRIKMESKIIALESHLETLVQVLKNKKVIKEDIDIEINETNNQTDKDTNPSSGLLE
jgi:hypothetical protein